ncbi:hypothetical protein [Thalassiella azotivora]
MTRARPRRRPGPRPPRARRVVALALATVVMAGACSGDRDEAADAAAREDGGQEVSAPTSSQPTPTAALVPVPPPSGEGDLGVVPEQGQPTLEPRPIDQAADLGDGLTVRVAQVSSVQVRGQGPGELSGPAVAVTVQVDNASSVPLDVPGVTVTLAYGDTEATPSSAEPAAPAVGPVPAGGSVTGTYVFLVPEEQRSSVLVRVGLAGSRPVVVFTGSATG